jgi:hypothetical protein
VTVWIRNNAPIAIEAWSVQVSYVAEDGRQLTDTVSTDAYMSMAIDRAALDRVPPGGTIAPGERRAIRVSVWNLATLHGAKLALALFTDLSFEGDAKRKDDVLPARDRDARELDRWLGALETAASKPVGQARAFLQQALTERRLDLEKQKSGLDLTSSTVESALTNADTRPGGLALMLTDLRRLFEAQRALAVRHRSERLQYRPLQSSEGRS